MEITVREDSRTWVTKRIFGPTRMGKVQLSQQRALYLVSFFNFGTEWLLDISATPQLLYNREGDPISHFTGGWVGLGAGQDRYGQSRPPQNGV